MLIIGAGIIFGVLGALMVNWGNPANMGICVACFLRDIAGALGLHQAGVVQYLRSEIIGFVLGAFLTAFAFREFRARGGSSPLIRFLLGAFVMIGALVLVSLSEVLRELLPLLGLPVEVRFLAFGLIMVLMMRYRPAGLMPIQAVAAQMRTGRVKRKKKKVKATVGMKQ